MGEPIRPDDVLVLEPRKVTRYARTASDGRPTLRVSYGDKVLDLEGDALALGERVFRCARFRAGDAAGEGSALAWTAVSAFLEGLLDAEILRREGAPEPAPRVYPPPALSAGPRARMPPIRWRSLADLCALVSAHGDRPVRPDAVETVLGARTISLVLRDDEGRQGGENGTPALAAPLAEQVPTDWRPCRYSGARFLDPRPMNVSALVQVQRHMDVIVAVIAAIRRRYAARSGGRRLDLGDLAILSEVMSVLPAWLLVRSAAPILNGEQPAWAQSLAKTINGVDMSLRWLAEASDEHTMTSPVGAADILCAAELSGFFGSASGVCAGTTAMIDRANRAFTGEDDPPGGEALFARCGALDEHLDYGLAWCALNAARILGDLRAIDATERAIDAKPLRDGDRAADDLRRDLAREREGLDLLDGPVERRVAMVERKLRGAEAVLGARDDDACEPTARAPSAIDAGDDAWACALRDVVAIERVTAAAVSLRQARLNARIGRATIAPVDRADLVAARRLRGGEPWSERVARFVGVAVP